MDEMAELKQEFLSEANELLNIMEDGSLKLENDPENEEAINGVFRVAHTLKGGAASLELVRITDFTHELENLFDKVRDGKIKIDEDIIDVILKSLDILKVLIEAAAKNVEAEEDIENETLQKIIDIQKEYEARANEGSASPESQSKKEEHSTAETVDVSFEDMLGDYENEKIVEALNEGSQIFQVSVVLNEDYPMKSVSGLQVYTALKELGEIIACQPHIDAILEEDFVPQIHLIFSSKLENEHIQDKIYISDVTTSVTVNDFKVDLQDEEEPQKQEKAQSDSGAKAEMDDALKNKISEKLAASLNVFKVKVEIEKDNPMRNVDSLLIYNTLEELGEILSASPTKEELRADKFFQFLDIIVASSYDKTRLKEKCSISGTTKNVKVAVFKPKPGSESSSEGASSQSPSDLAVLNTRVNKAEVLANATPQQVKKEPVQEKKQAAKTQSSSPTTVKSYLRVESGRVDTLMNLVSELVISKAGLIENAQQLLNTVENLRNNASESKKMLSEVELGSSTEDQQEDEKVEKLHDFFEDVAKSSWSELDSFENIINSTSRVINELQESVMKIRMVPISSIFNRFPRVVRDLSRQLGKKIDIEMDGEETELDKSVIEELLDPLVHMIRNSIDHGIGMPEDRVAEGKDERGKVFLSASHEGSMIKIEVADDGRGLDTRRIKAKAIEKGLIAENKELTKEEVFNLIFQPGFSTAQAVTEVSGRGVGMDVVRKKIENLSGSIFVDSERGKGSRFTIKIPLTLAIIQALIVEINTYSYSIPINNIVETLTISEDQIEMFENNEVIRLRDELITIINLKDIFNFKDEKKVEDENDYLKASAEKTADVKENNGALEDLDAEEELLMNERYVVVVEMSNKKAGFLVDTVVAEQDIVIKPLHKKYAMTKGISGATILGDGRISLIIDIYQLIDMYVKKEEYISIK